jgi:amino acid adenylation domain-containing protein/non-ribosomal peptide synthase protein (TIGR01720 family)
VTDVEGFQLSPQQQRLWQLQRTSGAFVSRYRLEIAGRLDPGRLERALAQAVARHEILRTTFPVPPGLTLPLQVTAGAGTVDWREEPAENLPEEPFDAGGGPLLRARLGRLGADRHSLTLTASALCADPRSLANLVGELVRAYAGDELEPVSMQYADYAGWRNEQLEGEEAVEGRAHWRGHGLTALGEVRLPSEREAEAPFVPAAATEVWPAARWREIEAAARAAGASPTAWMLAAWQGLLARLTDRASVTVGVLCEGREFAELAEALGPYAQYVPVRSGAADAGIDALAAALEGALAEAREWQDYFTWGGVGPSPAAGSSGLFPFCFDFTELPPACRAAEVELRPIGLEACLDRFRIRLGVLVTPEGARIELAYDPARFDPATVARLSGQLRALVEGALLTPGTPLCELALLSPEAREELLHRFNLPLAPAPPWEAGAGELFRRQAALTPGRAALEHGNRVLTYAELAAAAAAWAGRLRALGVGPDVVVGLFLERSTEMVVALIAVLQAGGAYLPLDPGLPAERLAFMLEDSGAALVLSSGPLAAKLPAGVPLVRLDEEQPAAVHPEAPAALPEQLAYVIYTSGSTGRPKGTLISHRALANYLGWAVWAYGSGGDGAPLHSPLAFDLTVTGLFVPLLSGQRVTLVAESLGLDGLAEALRRDREYSFLKLTPAHMEILRQQLGAADGLRCRALVLGGEPLLAAHVSWWLERAPATRVFNEYGPTEATVGCAVHELSAGDAAAAGSEALPIGRPIGGMRLHAVDGRFEPVPVGVAGELLIGGIGLARGYLGRPDLTAERFVPDPHGTLPGGRLYRSGDLARYRTDGSLEFLGRRDHQVKLHGYRIELGEIEAVLRQHPGVRDAVVLVDAPAGTPRLCACWSGPPPGPTAAELEAWLGSRLPTYMIPHLYLGAEPWPLTANGKVDRAALAALARGRAAGERHAYRPPRTRAERVLAEIWTELLPVDRVGLDDSFFQLGGDSIVSLQVLGRAGRHGLRLTTRQIFDHPTLAALAAVAVDAAEAAPATQGLVTGPVPLTPIQRGFFATPDPAPQHYDLLLSLRPLGVGEATLAGAVDALWRHHDALRLRFRTVDGAWVQENAGLDGPAPFTVLDFAALSNPARERALAAATGELAAGFDLATGPLARWAWLRLGDEPGGGRLLGLQHHLVADVVSLRILLEDLELACRQAMAGDPVVLPAKSTSFQRWAERLVEHAGSAELRGELASWLAVCRRATVPLPCDGPAGHATLGSSALCRQELDPHSTRALLQEVPRAYRTEIADVLLAALTLTLVGWSGGPVLVDLEGHGREDLFADLDPTRTVGWFTSLYPVLLELPEGATVRQVLIGVKEELRRLPRHGIGYGLLRHLCPDASVRQALAATPAAQVSFNYLGQLAAGGGVKGGLFATAGDPGTPLQGAGRTRPYLLEVNAWIAAGRLRVEWRYDRAAHRGSTVETLGARFLTELRTLIAHCRSQETAAATPSDFPLARLDQEQLERLIAGHGEIADLYPLAPIQESMLLHTLSFPGSDVGFEQTALHLRGEAVDAAALRRAWERLVERHAVLRTAFSWQAGEAALQVVLHGATPPWAEVDLTALPPAAREVAYRDLLIADRGRGFDLGRAPLLRLALVRLGAGACRLVWSRHHVLLDGWSTALVLGELETLYQALRRGTEPELPPCRPYRDYLAWLAGQDPGRTEAYWRRHLAGLAAPTPLAVERRSPRSSSTPRWTGRRRTLPAAFDAAWRELAGRHSLTMNLLLHAAWACLLSRYSGEPEVVFGATVAGRPADLPGVETMVGLFIKNLPIRVRGLSDGSVLSLLADLRRAQVELREHEAASPADVQPWSDVPGYLPLFESLVVFENYPVESRTLVAREGESREEENAAAVRTAYPLTLVAAQIPRLVLLLVYDTGRFEDTAVRRMLGHLENLLREMVEDPERSVSGLPLLGAGERHQLVHEWGWDPAGGRRQILDNRRRPVPAGVVGELWEVHPGVDPAATGELALFLDDGGIVPLGREDRLVRVQGRLADPRRLEAVLAEHPAVAAAAAVLRGDAADPGGPQLLAYVQPAPGATPAVGELRAFLRERWTGGPQPAELVFLAALPRRPDGTVSPDALPSPEAERLAADLSGALLGAGGDLLETQLARLWEDVLGTRPIGPDDDFFALGGSSVAALRLVSRIRRELGRDLPLAALLDGAATVRRLAAHLRSDAAALWSPLVPIRPGGDRRPLFLVHPVGGNVLCFVDLARRLAPGRPVYGLQAAGLGNGRPPFDRLTKMATCYLREIRRVQPAGPYLLGGLSFGGYVAFEMAGRLRAEGEEIALLALLDTASPLYRGEHTFQTDAAAVLALQAGAIARAGGSRLDLAAEELRGLGRATQLDRTVDRLLTASPAARELGAEPLRRVLSVYQGHALCLENYRPHLYSGRITVFRASEEHRALDAMLDHPAQHEPDYGWGELSAQPIEVRRVPGDHSTLVYEPHVRGLARELDLALTSADVPDAAEAAEAADGVVAPVEGLADV